MESDSWTRLDAIITLVMASLGSGETGCSALLELWSSGLEHRWNIAAVSEVVMILHSTELSLFVAHMNLKK